MSISSVIALGVAVVFGLIGLVQLAGPMFVRQTYERWGYSQRIRVVTGVLDLAAAILLAAPSLRAWGIALAAVLTFGSVVILLAHRHYVNASLTMGLMAALIPATLAVPRSGPIQFVQMRAESALIREAADVANRNTLTASLIE